MSKEKEVTCTVNGKPITVEKKTRVRRVLELAGYDAASHYLAEIQPNGEKEYRNVEQEIVVKDGGEYIAYYTGTTPLS